MNIRVYKCISEYVCISTFHKSNSIKPFKKKKTQQKCHYSFFFFHLSLFNQLVSVLEVMSCKIDCQKFFFLFYSLKNKTRSDRLEINLILFCFNSFSLLKITFNLFLSFFSQLLSLTHTHTIALKK